jgi:hypothetical protein
VQARGWIYVLTNESLPGLVKIGFSLKDPSLRVGELSATGVPRNFALAYEAMLAGPRDLEQAVHVALRSEHESKEFFRTSPGKAVRVIRTMARERGIELTLERSLVAEASRPERTAIVSKGWGMCPHCGAPRAPNDNTVCSRCLTPFSPAAAKPTSLPTARVPGPPRRLTRSEMTRRRGSGRSGKN